MSVFLPIFFCMLLLVWMFADTRSDSLGAQLCWLLIALGLIAGAIISGCVL